MTRSGALVRVSGVTIDITDRKAAEERQTLLSREVDHRAKNALALVQSIVRLTRHADPADYARAIEGRINALSRVHTVLSQSRWQGADLGGLLREELAPFRTARRRQDRRCRPRAFARPGVRTDAGARTARADDQRGEIRRACRRPAGRLRVHWTISGDHLNLEWSEDSGIADRETRQKRLRYQDHRVERRGPTRRPRQTRLAAGRRQLRDQHPAGADLRTAATGHPGQSRQRKRETASTDRRGQHHYGRRR